MSDKSENPPAFPQLSIESGQRDGHGDLIDPITASIGGLTMRDYFAGQALTSMTIAPDYSAGPCNGVMAKRAYNIADAMLKVRRS